MADNACTTPKTGNNTATTSNSAAANNSAVAENGQKAGGSRKKQTKNFPLAIRPTYPIDWNGPDNLVDENRNDSRDPTIANVYRKLGGLKLMEVVRTNNMSPGHVTGDRVAKGLIRHLLQSQLYYSDEKAQNVGYASGADLINDEQFFSVLFSGIMAETIVRVPHYVYTINFCDKLVENEANGDNGVRTDPDFTIAVFSLMEAVKNIHEETLRQYDGSGASATAYGWLNVWLLGVQRILICKVPSDTHLRMFRNAVAHHQFFLINNYVQMYNKSGKESNNKSGGGSIDWMVRITLADMFTMNRVLKMLHNSGYILNSSQDDQNMERRKRGGDNMMQAETLRGLLVSVGLDPTDCPYRDVLTQCDNNVDAAFKHLKEMFKS